MRLGNSLLRRTQMLWARLTFLTPGLRQHELVFALLVSLLLPAELPEFGFTRSSRLHEFIGTSTPNRPVTLNLFSRNVM